MKSSAVLLTQLQRFVEVRFPIRHILQSIWLPAGERPDTLNAAAQVWDLRGRRNRSPRVPSGRRPGRATFLSEQSPHCSLAPVRQRPGLDAHRQRTV